MKLPQPLLFLALLLAPLTAPAAPARDDTELARHMERIEDAMKPLRRALRSVEGAPEALAALLEIQRATLECKTLEPKAAAVLPEAERHEMVRAYRRALVDFQMRQLELEAAVLDGEVEAARAAFERLHALEDSQHERFAPEEH
jgi:hypothetical protein